MLLDGERLAYAALVVATGARARELPRTSPDVTCRASTSCAPSTTPGGPGRARRGRADRRRRGGLHRVGGGQRRRARGLPATVVEVAPQPLVRALGEPVAALVSALHERAGTDLRRGTSVVALEGDGRVERVLLSDGDVSRPISWSSAPGRSGDAGGSRAAG